MAGSEPRCVVLVTFPVDDPPPDAALAAMIETAAKDYLSQPELKRKYFIAEAGRGGGIYEWASRAAAEAFHDGAWRAGLEGRCGKAIEVRFFDVPAVADGEAGELFCVLRG